MTYSPTRCSKILCYCGLDDELLRQLAQMLVSWMQPAPSPRSRRISAANLDTHSSLDAVRVLGTLLSQRYMVAASEPCVLVIIYS